jgi:hypothetical protein
MSRYKYDYGRIRILATKLEEAGVAQDAIEKIMEGGDLVLAGASPEKKADWMKGAMDCMDALLNPETRHAIRQGCACCLGGKRLEITKGISKTHQSFEDRFKAAQKAKFVFGDSLTMRDDGKMLVQFFPDGQEHYRCVCLPKAKEPISVTYCYCCGGHIKHHLQTALGVRASCEVVSSALASGGKEPCKFLFTIEE